MAITTVFKDAIPKTEYRHYQQIKNSDGTVSMIDVTEYEQEGTHLNAETLNNYTSELNQALASFLSTTVDTVLQASAWVDNTITLTVQGVTATSIQEIIPSTTITQEQLEALQSANIVDGGQSTNTIILKAFGDVPTIDIPITVLLRGGM